MALIENMILSLAPVLAGPIYTAWRKHTGKTPENTASVRELIARSTQDKMIVNELTRQIEWLSEKICFDFVDSFVRDGGRFSDSKNRPRSDEFLQSISKSLAKTIEEAGISPQFIIQCDQNPIYLYHQYVPYSHKYTVGLDKDEKTFFNQSLLKLCNSIVDIVVRLPQYSHEYEIHIRNELRSEMSSLREEIQLALQKARDFWKSKNIENATNHVVHTYLTLLTNRVHNVKIFGLDDFVKWKTMDLSITYISLRAIKSSSDPDLQQHQPQMTESSVIGRRADDLIDVPADIVLTKSRRCVIRGHAGSGKTTLLQWLALTIAQGNPPPDLAELRGTLPIYIRLRDYADQPLPKGMDVLAATAGTLVPLMEKQWFLTLLSNGDAAFLVDGFDEVSGSRFEEIKGWLSEWVSLSPKSRFIVTTRPTAAETGFLDDLDFNEYFLRRMNPGEVHQFVHYWHKELIEKFAKKNDTESISAVKKKKLLLQALLDTNDQLRKLATTPLLCSIICALNYLNKMQGVRGRRDLYQTAAKLLIHHRDSERKIQNEMYNGLSIDEKIGLLGEIAYWHLKRDQMICKRKSVINAVGRFFNEQQQKERGIVVKELAEALILRSGVLQEVGDGSVQFVHKTFQEYFAASSIVWHSDEDIALGLDLANWSELAIMITSMISSRKPLRNFCKVY